MSGGGERGLDDLYGDMILDHNRRPRNFGHLDGATHSAVGNNPLCGDRVTVYLKIEGGRVADIAFEGAGCAISTASASMMTEALRGRSLAEARRLFEQFRGMLTADGEAEELGKLAAFAGVRQFPMRVKCATLAWHAVQSALAAPAATAATVPAQPAGGVDHGN